MISLNKHLVHIKTPSLPYSVIHPPNDVTNRQSKTPTIVAATNNIPGFFRITLHVTNISFESKKFQEISLYTRDSNNRG